MGSWTRPQDSPVESVKYWIIISLFRFFRGFILMGISILKYKWILRSLKHARFFEHDGAAEIEQVF
jgi:hypothetical protein